MKSRSDSSSSDPSVEAGLKLNKSARKKILLVEDEAIIAVAESALLKENGYDVVTARSGEESIDIIKADPSFDLVLMDIHLGKGIRGTEAAREILALQTLPIVFLTSHSEREMVETVHGITRYGYVIKNSGDSVLISSIEMAFELFEAHWNLEESVRKRTEELNNINIRLLAEITERTQAEEALWRSEERYRLAADFTHDWGYWVAPDGEFLYMSPSCERISGYSRDEFINDKDLMTAIIHPDDRTIFEAHICSSLDKSKADAAECEYRIITRDNEIRWLHHLCQPIYDDERSFLGRRISTRDNTERRKAEEEVKSLLAEKELLLREVHHRIKNNMNTMMNLISLQAKTMQDPKAVAALKDARSRLQSMGVLYDKLYRSESFREVPINDYLPALINEIIGMFPNRGMVKIETFIEDFSLGAEVISPLGIMINELVTNVMKHALIGRDDGLIRISASKKSNRATLIIEDNGAGIPESIDIATSTGFGLQLVGLLTEQLGGTIRLEREKGSRFILEFDV
jgi:PAS domain S-box-containing protein